MLCELIQQFDRIAGQLLVAVGRDDAEQVSRLDAQLQTAMRHIFDLQAQSRSDMSLQIDFFNRLALRHCEDCGSVGRYTDMMSSLFERYLDSGAGLTTIRSGVGQDWLPDGYDPSLHELVLDSVPERVAVIGLDYRYLYCNKRNAEFHDKRPSDFIGRHLLDIIDLQRYLTRAKPRLDQCFGGARLAYDYEAADAHGRLFAVNCRMSPLSGNDDNVAGAVLVLSMQPVFASAT